jgi:hypothetical protein
MLIDNNDKINYIPHQLVTSSNYNTNFTINSNFKEITYRPDFFTGTSARFIINSNGFLDPYSLNLMFSIQITDEIDKWYQLDNSAHSLISSIIISSNGIELERIDDYAYINSILFDINFDLESRKHFEHHGFGSNTIDDLSYGCDEDCFPNNDINNDFFKKFKNFKQKNTVSVQYGIPENTNSNRIKTYILPLMSFLFGMNVGEYKYIPLHLFPYLQIEINFNNYGLFVRSDSEILIKNRVQNVEIIKDKTMCKSKIINELTTIFLYFESINLEHFINTTYLAEFLINCQNILFGVTTQIEWETYINNLPNFDQLIRTELRIWSNNELENLINFILNLICFSKIGKVLHRHTGVLYTGKTFYYVDNILYVVTNDDETFLLNIFRILENYAIEYGKLLINNAVLNVNNNENIEKRTNYGIIDHNIDEKCFYGYNNNIYNNKKREFIILPSLNILTEQLFFETSYHYKMINSINSFSMISIGYDTQKIEFENKKPKEYGIVNFPRKSIKKFISCFYNRNYLNSNLIRQLGRYSKNVTRYSVRIGVDTYPQYSLIGNTSSIGVENQNNSLFINELNKCFNKNDYGSYSCGIINSKNYALDLQFGDKIDNINNNILPTRLNIIKNDIVGRCIICVRTSKLTQTIGLFTGIDNSNGSDIVRSIQCLEGNNIDIEGEFYELILAEYDIILVVDGIGKFKIIK